MALVWLEGFEKYGPVTTTGQTLEDNIRRSGWGFVDSYYAGAVSLTLEAGRCGGVCAKWTQGTLNDLRMRKNFSRISTTMLVGLAIFPGWNYRENLGLIAFMHNDSSSAQCTLCINSSGCLFLTATSPLGTPLTTSTIPLHRNRWNYLEILVTIGDTGSVQVKQNGETVINASPLDTMYNTVTGCDGIGFYGHTGLAIDDIYVYDDNGGAPTFVGPMVVEDLVPSGDITTDWIPSSNADHYTLVSETPVNTSNYVNASNTSDRDLWSYANLSQIDGTILGAQIDTLAKLETAGIQTLKNVCLSGANESNESVVIVSTEFIQDTDTIITVDPNTATAWDVAGINGAQFGVEVG